MHKEEYITYMENKVAGQSLNFVETSAGLSGDKKYFVRLGISIRRAKKGASEGRVKNQ